MRTIFVITALYSVLTGASAQTILRRVNDTTAAETASPGEHRTISDSLPVEPTILTDDAASDTPVVAVPDTAVIAVPADSVTTAASADTLKPPPNNRRRKRGVPAFSPPESLYTGISPEQDNLARTYVSQIFAFSWDEAARTAKKLQRLERRYKLPSLSTLLMVSSRVIRLLNGEFENDNKQKQMLREIEELKTKFLRQLDDRSPPDSLLPIYLLIEGGVRGLCAVIKIETNVVEAAVDGFAALHRLERLLEISPDFSDAYLGLGIFYCSLARAPAIVRAALNITGRQVSFERGLDYLRRSAYHGRYTAEIASLYLVQFLSPYFGHLVAEKDTIFSWLQHRYPDNPYYVFLAVDETICFHPLQLDRAYRLHLEETICSWKAENFSLRRYDNLVRHQLLFIADSIEQDTPLPDTLFNLKEFSFYPRFLEALKEQRTIREDGEDLSARRSDLLTKNASTAVRMLGLSAMSSPRRNFYEWHIRDALRIR